MASARESFDCCGTPGESTFVAELLEKAPLRSSPIWVLRSIRRTRHYVISGTLFNILIDAIIRHWYEEVSLIETVGIARTVDDRNLSGQDPLVIRQALDLLVQVNTLKTKTMIVTGGRIIAQQSTPAYKRRMTGEGDTHREKKRTQVTCPMCETTM
jgi:hypothetical protein